ncbi:hypothetical protein Tco_1372457 [Tanacetum coccineum]
MGGAINASEGMEVPSSAGITNRRRELVVKNKAAMGKPREGSTKEDDVEIYEDIYVYKGDVRFAKAVSFFDVSIERQGCGLFAGVAGGGGWFEMVLVWERLVLLGTEERVSYDFHGELECSQEYESHVKIDRDVTEGRENVREVFQTNVDVRTLAIEEAYTTKYSIHPGADTMLCGFRLTNRWLSMKKDIASCDSKYLAYSKVEVEY